MDQLITSGERYATVVNDLQQIARANLIFGLHVHIGIPDREEIRRRLADKLADAFDRVWDLSGKQALSLRDAALVAGLKEVSAALEARGLYP